MNLRDINSLLITQSQTQQLQEHRKTGEVTQAEDAIPPCDFRINQTPIANLHKLEPADRHHPIPSLQKTLVELQSSLIDRFSDLLAIKLLERLPRVLLHHVFRVLLSPAQRQVEIF